MFAPSEAMYLPLVVIDVSEHRSVRSQSKRSTATEGSSRAVSFAAPSRALRLAASVRTNIVRLVPGHTRLPFEPAAR